jgi:AraC-like DNA-binding protein
MQNHSLREKRVHGSAAYPVSVYSVRCREGDPVFECHWHSELEFLVVTQGTALFQIGSSEYKTSAGEFIFVNSEELHAGQNISNGLCAFSAVVFDGSFLDSAENDVIKDKYLLPLLNKHFIPPDYYGVQPEWHAEIAQTLWEIVRLNKTKTYPYELMTKMYLYRIFGYLFQYCAEMQPERTAAPVNEKLNQLKTILDFIHTNYPEHITLQDMAARMNMSQGYFCRFFKATMKKTPFEYLISYRVHKAALLLQGSGLKVSQIAQDTGFENFSYFTEVFKKTMRCTPSEYRRLTEDS